MASEEPTYSSEFKAKIALEALAQNKKNLDRLSDKYDVPVSVILTWTVQLERNAANVYATSSEPANVTVPRDEDTVVDVEINDEKVSHSISYGVMGDKLDYKKLTFWSVLGVILVVIFVQLLMEMYDQATQINEDRISASSEYYDIQEQNRKDMERLSSFGVVDIENGVYRMPIDSVINDMAVDGE